MAKERSNNIRLGIFVLAGLFFLVLTLYLLGKNKNLFGSTFILKAQFENVNGLRAGNNVRFAGIEVGTVKKVKILSDTLIEVTMAIDTKVKKFIMKNAEATIGTDGFVGNKVVNISSVARPSLPVDSGDMLASKKSTDMEEMLKTLDKTNRNIAIVSEGLKQTILRINESKALWSLLDDSTLPIGIRNSVANVRSASSKANAFADQLNQVIADIRSGKGTIGNLLTDTTFVHSLNEAAGKIKEVGENANTLVAKLGDLTADIQSEIDNGKGTVNLLLKDTTFAGNLDRSMSNIEKASEKLDQNMEALKHNFLFRGYFRKLEKQKSRN